MGMVWNRAGELAAELAAAGIPATTDPGAAMGLLPCILIGPPVREPRHYGGDVVAWRLMLLADVADVARSWEQLDDMLDTLSTVLPWESAEPTSYVLPSGTDPVPAYAVTMTETVTGED